MGGLDGRGRCQKTAETGAEGLTFIPKPPPVVVHKGARSLAHREAAKARRWCGGDDQPRGLQTCTPARELCSITSKTARICNYFRPRWVLPSKVLGQFPSSRHAGTFPLLT